MYYYIETKTKKLSCDLSGIYGNVKAIHKRIFFFVSNAKRSQIDISRYTEKWHLNKFANKQSDRVLVFG